MTPWSGSVLAAGFVFDETLMGREALVKRLLAVWSDGARLARGGSRWYLVGLSPRRVDARVSPGAPLVSVEGRWLVGGVGEEALRAAPMDAVLECRDSAPFVMRFDALTATHPADLLSLEMPVALEASDLAPPPAPVVTVRPPATLDALFGPMLTALPRAVAPVIVAAPAPPAPTLWARLTGWFSRGAPLPDPLPGGAREVPLETAEDFRNEPPDSQRRYLEDLRRRFDLGDLAEALRRAIPLGGSGAGGGPATHAAPPRRESISLLAPVARGGPSMVMANDEFEQMKKMYRAAADALIEKGQIEEAAYVLAKLLNDSLAAVALLEKHRHFELAAQLATTQGLPPVDRIRLWLLAGRKDEAIRVARASNDFEALISTMSSRWPELARQLRVAWGEFLAEHHRYTEALVATSRLPMPPEAWPTWLEYALEAGGASAVTALAVDVARHPAHGDEVRAQLTNLLHDDARSTLTRTAAQVMLEHAPKAPGPLYRDVWRGLMRGASRGDAVDRQLVERVLRATGDQPLALDAVPSAPSTLRAAPAPLELPAPVVTSLPVLDVAPLPKGRKALAHGAAGLRIISSSGETLRHLLVKADVLVAGPIGAPVLVLSRDGALTRTWKLDAHQFTLTSWFQASLSAWPRRYDGLTWAVGMEDSLVMLDPAAPSAMEWWRVPNLACSAIDTSGSNLIVLATDAQKETWRRVFHPDPQRVGQRFPASTDVFVRSDGLHRVWSSRTREDGRFEVKSGERVVLLPASAQWHTWPMEVGVLFVRVLAGATEVLLIDWERFELRVLARLAGTMQVKVRDLTPERLALCDEHGRVTELDV